MDKSFQAWSMRKWGFSGTLNAFFIVGRSIGFIGHILDEKRLAMPMYRHPMDDVLYDVQMAEEI